jgi:hypothetical protein
VKYYRDVASVPFPANPHHWVEIGKAIQRDKLFEYTHGRFLANEKYKVAKCFAKFDVVEKIFQGLSALQNGGA